ncbi:MAG: MATE family efflux transporter [Kiritimatiellae bacterium]|nr:MATE family efflux transporter [Kiritimatiellia bacterium]
MIDKNKKLLELEKAPLGRLLFAYSWPALVAMTLNALYVVVDRFYIGYGCGEEAMAGLTLTFPFMMLFGAFGVWIGVGHSSLLSIKLGEGDYSATEKILGEMVALKTLLVLILPPIVFFFLDPLLLAVGGKDVSPGVLSQAKIYLQLVLFAQVFSHHAFGLSAAMRAEGSAFSSMVCMIVGFGANLILDPLFIFSKHVEFSLFEKVFSFNLGFGMGVAGAAWATNIAMLLSCVYAFGFYLRKKSVVKLRLSCLRVYLQYVTRAMKMGTPPFLQHLMGSLINFSLQMALAMWAADKAEATLNIAALGVFQATVILFVLPVFGLQQGVSPIFGYNWGARNYLRVREVLILGVIVSTCLVTLACLVNVLFPEVIAKMFSDGKGGAFVLQTAKVLRISNCLLWCIGLNITMTTFFQSIGRPWMAVVLSLLRQCICLLPCIWLLPLFLEDKILGVWLATPASDILACIATLPPFILYLRFLKRAGNNSRR